MLRGILLKNRVVLWNLKSTKKIYDKDFFGTLKNNHIELSLLEAAYLLDNKKLEIKHQNKNIDYKKFMDYCLEIDPRFIYRYIVYKDLRSKGLPTRSGFKFGCDFRVYEKGVKPMKRGPKTAKEHTKWIVHAVPGDFECSFQELSRAVRLAHNIRANMLWAIIDSKGNVAYYQVTFFKP
jgi:tRNA-intron endonuclease